MQLLGIMWQKQPRIESPYIYALATLKVR